MQSFRSSATETDSADDGMPAAIDAPAVARSDAVRLLRQALAVIDRDAALSEVARRQQQMERLAATAAREEADRVLAETQSLRVSMLLGAVPDADPLDGEVDAIDLTDGASQPTLTQLSR